MVDHSVKHNVVHLLVKSTARLRLTYWNTWPLYTYTWELIYYILWILTEHCSGFEEILLCTGHCTIEILIYYWTPINSTWSLKPLWIRLLISPRLYFFFAFCASLAPQLSMSCQVHIFTWLTANGQQKGQARRFDCTFCSSSWSSYKYRLSFICQKMQSGAGFLHVQKIVKATKRHTIEPLWFGNLTI